MQSCGSGELPSKNSNKADDKMIFFMIILI
jgi:hypothetical protein